MDVKADREFTVTVGHKFAVTLTLSYGRVKSDIDLFRSV